MLARNWTRKCRYPTTALQTCWHVTWHIRDQSINSSPALHSVMPSLQRTNHVTFQSLQDWDPDVVNRNRFEEEGWIGKVQITSMYGDPCSLRSSYVPSISSMLNGNSSVVADAESPNGHVGASNDVIENTISAIKYKQNRTQKTVVFTTYLPNWHTETLCTYYWPQSLCFSLNISDFHIIQLSGNTSVHADPSLR